MKAGEVWEKPGSGASGKRAVLLIDDEVAHVERLAREFVALAWQASIETASESVLIAVKRLRPTLVVMEPALPGTSWFRMLHELRVAAPQLPLIVATAFPSSSLVDEASQLGVRNVCVKPVSASQLLELESGRGPVVSSGEGMPSAADDGDLSLAHMEWEHLNHVLRRCRGNLSESARRLGIARQSLYNKLRKLPPRFSPDNPAAPARLPAPSAPRYRARSSPEQ
jgi:two-component system, response regulator RegA